MNFAALQLFLADATVTATPVAAATPAATPAATATAAATATPKPLTLPGGNPADGLGHAGLMLAGVLVMLMVGIYLLKNGFPMARRGTGERNLHIRESRMLGNRQFIVVVEYEQTRMLLGLTPGKIDYLCQLPPPAPKPEAPAPEAPAAPETKPAGPVEKFTLPLIAALLLLGTAAAQAQDPLTLPPGRLPVTAAPAAPAPAPALDLTQLIPGTSAPAVAAPTTSPASSASAANPLMSLQVGGGTEQQRVSSAIQILVVMTLLTLAPSLVMLMTSFTRIVIVLGFVRTALGVQGAPTNQIIIGISLFLTFFIMGPIYTKVNDEALQPYLSGKMAAQEAMDKAAAPMREFMLRQTRPSETEFFLKLSGSGPTKVEDVPLRVLIPAFVISELRTAFQMGFLIFIPFLAIDFLVSSTLMSMGMMMMPPVVVSLPFKLLLFVLVDGWQLVIRSLVESFAT